jgi:hypothetical protein
MSAQRLIPITITRIANCCDRCADASMIMGTAPTCPSFLKLDQADACIVDAIRIQTTRCDSMDT